MIRASLYIIICTARNRMRVRLRRLREPRYLIGAVVGAAYIYFSFFARMGSGRGSISSRGRRGRDGGSGPMPSLVQNASGAVGLLFFIGAALGWILPFNSSMLEFSDAEMAFLFPAPVSRRTLIVHRLMRSQLGVLFTAVISALAFPSGAFAGRVCFAMGMWVVLTATRVYFTGVTLARSRLLAASGSARTLAWAPIAVVALALAVVGRAVASVFAAAPPTGLADLATRLDGALQSGAARVVLWPFMALSRPLFLPWGVDFVVAIAAAAGVLAVTTIWVLQTDGALQDVAADAAARRAASTQSRGGSAIRAGETGFTLAAAGRPEAVFFWKNAVQTMRTGGYPLIRYFVPAVAIATAASSIAFSRMRMSGGADAAFTIAVIITMFVAVLGPQALRADLRNDLRHLEVLKTWPLQASAVVRGEMLWASTLLTGLGWVAIACATMLSAAAFPRVPLPTRLVAALCALVLMPAFVTAQYLVHAAATVVFPAWVPTGNQRPRGLDAMGQRLIMLAGVLVSVILLLLPGAIAGGVVWLALRPFIGVAVFVPAAMVCTTVVALEVLAGTEALGPLFEKLDVLSVERGE